MEAIQAEVESCLVRASKIAKETLDLARETVDKAKIEESQAQKTMKKWEKKLKILEEQGEELEAEDEIKKKEAKLASLQAQAVRVKAEREFNDVRDAVEHEEFTGHAARPGLTPALDVRVQRAESDLADMRQQMFQLAREAGTGNGKMNQKALDELMMKVCVCVCVCVRACACVCVCVYVL